MEVVILCGGRGVRAYPFSEYFPKVMMPIQGTPILVHLMRIYADQGFTNFVLAAGHRKEVLLDYFDDKFPHWNVKVVDTGDDSNTGERILRCADYVGERFFASYGDGLGDIDLHKLQDFHDRSGGLATLTSVPLRSQYGTVVFNENNNVTRFVEKPVIPDCWINAGFFVFEKKAFDHWQGRDLEVDVLPHLASMDALYTYLHRGFWKSMDTSKDQMQLQRLCPSDVTKAPWVQRGATATA